MRLAAALFLVALSTTARADTAGADLTPEVKKLVDAWLLAQNGGDFAAYEKLYAAKLTGVRRSGARTVQLDRAGWMADRRRMFAKPMKVSASELRIAATPTTARVTFLQEWESGSYHDRGQKQLVVARQEGAWKIAREEMLESERAPAEGALGAGEKLSLLMGRYAIVADEAEDGWSAGAARLDDEDDPVTTSKRAVALPPELAKWLGRKMIVYAPGAAACTATVKEVRVVGFVVPHFGLREDWKQSNKSARARAAEAWEMSAHLVGALLDGCDTTNAAFARAAELPPVQLVTPVRDKTLRAAGIAAMRALPSWKALQKSYLAEHGKGPWDSHATDAEITVDRWDLPTPLVTVAAHAMDGCAGFGGEIFAVYELHDGKLTLVGEPRALRPEAALMLDGAPVFVGGQGWQEFGVARQAVPVKGPPRRIEVRYLDCPC
ncbi:MAG: hypothetical protein JWN44_3305 [Myxococcales bacterium]|nr:hypothetical protein [Myxococcales bacterium]